MDAGTPVKRRIFVGSSSQQLSKAHEICRLLKTFGDVEPVLWTGVFDPGLVTFEALEEMLVRCCAAVLVATPDDHVNLNGKDISAPRSNIMLEFGLLAGRLGRHNIALCCYGGVQLPTDLGGLTYVDMDNAEPDMRPQDKLKNWASKLLPTADMIARTDIVHGYTGRWDFNLQLDRWRNFPISSGDYVYVKGMLDLVITANGQNGKGLAHGRLLFKLTIGADADRRSYQGEFQTAHEITGAYCETDGSLHFTSEAFVVKYMTPSVAAPPGLSGLDVAEPWQALWQLSPSSEPRALEGCVSTNDVVGTHGTARIVKS